MKRFTIIAVAVIAGCATQTSGVLPARGENTFIIVRHASTGFIPLDQIKADADKEATSFCQALGKRMEVVDVKDTPTAFGVYPESRVTFRCIG